MTDKKQPEPLRIADELEEPLRDFPEPTTLEAEAASELRRQHAELEALRAKLKTHEDLGDAGSDMQLLRTGYEAARLEIESLKAQLHAAKQINTAQFWLFTSSIPGSALRVSHWQAPAREAPTPAAPEDSVLEDAALPESLILAVDRWFSANTGLGGCSDKDVRELVELFYAVTHAGGRESVDDALAIVESFGPGISGINDTYARQILLAEEVKRLRASHGQAPAVKREFTNELGNSIRITVEGPNSMHENIVTPMEAKQLREALNEHAQKSAPAGATLVHLDHIACIDGGELRYITGRKAPAYDCELYAMPNGGSAPQLYAAPTTQPSHKQEVQANTKTHDLLGTMIGLFLGAKDKIGYKPGSVVDKVVAEAVEHLKDWPYPEPAPQQEAQEPVAVVVPCYTPSGKRVALYSAKQDLPIGTKLYAAPQPPTAPATQQGAADGFFLLLPQRPKPEAPAETAGLDWDAYSGAQMLAFGRDCSDAAIAALRAQQPAPATQQAGVALSDDLRDRLVAISEAVADQDDRAAQAMLREILKAPQAVSVTALAETTPHPARKPDTLVNGGALKIALNVLRRAGKNEVADELLRTAQAAPDSVLEDAARLDFLIKHRAYVVSDPDACPGYWLHFFHKETGKCWTQIDEHPTPRAAIDVARAAQEGKKP